MHDLRCPYHPTAEYLPEALKAQAYAEYRAYTAELLDEGVAQPGITRLSWPGTDENSIGFDVEGLLEGDGIVAVDNGFRAQLTEVLDQVVDERVVIVDHQYAGGHRSQRYPGRDHG